MGWLHFTTQFPLLLVNYRVNGSCGSVTGTQTAAERTISIIRNLLTPGFPNFKIMPSVVMP